MIADGVRLSLAEIEIAHLVGLIDDFTEVLVTLDDESDPAFARLTPDVYPDDAAASAEFSAATRDDLLDRRAAEAATVRRGLVASSAAEAASIPDNGLEMRDVVIRMSELDAWLRTLTALRLVIASRLGMTTDDDQRDPGDSRYAVYDWLGIRLDGVIALADDLDEGLG